MGRRVILIQDHIGRKCATCMYSEYLRDEAGRRVIVCWRYSRAVSTVECKKYKRNEEIIKRYEKELVSYREQNGIPFVRLDEIIITVRLKKYENHNKGLFIFADTYNNKNVLIGEYLFRKRSINLRTFVGHTIQSAKDLIDIDNADYLKRTKAESYRGY